MINLKSKITREVLSYFMLQNQSESYVNELARKLRLDSGNLARKLVSLEIEGVLRSEQKGHQKYYSLNPSYPLLNEFKTIVLKTVGIEFELKKALKNVEGIQKAFLFGSYAENKMDNLSDIDLFVIGTHDSMKLRRNLSNLQDKMDREINLVEFAPDEWEKRKEKDPLIKSIMTKKTILLT